MWDSPFEAQDPDLNHWHLNKACLLLVGLVDDLHVDVGVIVDTIIWYSRVFLCFRIDSICFDMLIDIFSLSAFKLTHAGRDITIHFYSPSSQNLTFLFERDHIEIRRKLCLNPLARLTLLPGPAIVQWGISSSAIRNITIHTRKYAHDLCFVVFCCGLVQVDFTHIP